VRSRAQSLPRVRSPRLQISKLFAFMMRSNIGEKFQLFTSKPLVKKQLPLNVLFNFFERKRMGSERKNARILKFANANAPLAMNANAQISERVQVYEKM